MTGEHGKVEERHREFRDKLLREHWYCKEAESSDTLDQLIADHERDIAAQYEDHDDIIRLDARSATIEEICTGFLYPAHCDLCRALSERDVKVAAQARREALEEAARLFDISGWWDKERYIYSESDISHKIRALAGGSREAEGR